MTFSFPKMSAMIMWYSLVGILFLDLFSSLLAPYVLMIGSKILSSALKHLLHLILICLSNFNFLPAYTCTVCSGQIKPFSASVILSHSAFMVFALLEILILPSTSLLPKSFINIPLQRHLTWEDSPACPYPPPNTTLS